MNILSAFSSLDGRIGRKSFWIALIILMIGGFALQFILALILGVSLTQPSALHTIIATLVLIYPTTALYAQRFNDRNRPSWFRWISPALTLPFAALNMAEMIYVPKLLSDPGQAPMLTTIGWTWSVAAMVIGVWFLIECGFLKGTTDANRYGPDPLG